MAGGLSTNATTSLLMELIQRSALDISQMTDGDHHRIVWIEVLSIKLMIVRNNLRTTWIGIFLFHLLQLILHHLLATLWVSKDFLQVGD